MSGDLSKLLEQQKKLNLSHKRQLGLVENDENNEVFVDDRKNDLDNNNVEAVEGYMCSPKSSYSEPCFHLNLDNLTPKSGNELSREERKMYLAEKLATNTSPFSYNLNNGKTHPIRYGEFSPNNPQIRAAARLTAPYLGVGEYEQVKKAFREQERADYLRHISEKSAQIKELSKIIRKPRSKEDIPLKVSAFVQTDIQDIRSKLVQYDYYQSQKPAEREFSPRYATNEFTPSPKQFKSNEKYLDNLASPVNRNIDLDTFDTPTFLDKFSYSDPKDDLEKERIKREEYQRDLKLQIEEKKRLQAKKEEEERRQKEKENRKLEEQLRRMQIEKQMELNEQKEKTKRISDSLRIDLPKPLSRIRLDSESNSPRTRKESFANLAKVAPKVAKQNFDVSCSPIRSSHESPRLRSQSCTSMNSNLKSPSSHSILAQLGTIRAQLHKQQLKMDESIKNQHMTRSLGQSSDFF